MTEWEKAQKPIRKNIRYLKVIVKRSLFEQEIDFKTLFLFLL